MGMLVLVFSAGALLFAMFAIVLLHLRRIERRVEELHILNPRRQGGK